MNTKQEFDVNNELSKQMRNPGVEEEKGSVKKILKGVFNIATGENPSLVNAGDAYLRVKYKEYTTLKKLFALLLSDIKNHIKTRIEQGALYTLVEIQPELMDYAEEIAAALRQYDYQVWVLDKQVLNQLQPDTPVNRTTMFMLILWDKVY